MKQTDPSGQVKRSRKALGMNRFFFHFSCGNTLIHDDNGRDCADLATAHNYARQLVAKLIALDEMDWRGWSIKVTDADDRSILSVLFPQMSCNQIDLEAVKHGRDGKRF